MQKYLALKDPLWRHVLAGVEMKDGKLVFSMNKGLQQTEAE